MGKKQVTFSKLTSARGQHTVIAFAGSISLEPFGVKTASMGTEELLGSIVGYFDPLKFKDKRFKLLDHRVSWYNTVGGTCAKVDFTAEDHGVPYAPGSVFILTGQDNYCLHPESPAPLMVQVSYSQRYLKGKKPLPIESEVEPFVKSLNFTPIQ